MALDALDAMANNTSFVGEVHYDLESFLWTYLYAILKRILSNKKDDENKQVEEAFHACFSKPTVREIVAFRNYRTIRPYVALVKDKVPPALAAFFDDAIEMINLQNAPTPAAKFQQQVAIARSILTYEEVLKRIDEAIEIA